MVIFAIPLKSKGSSMNWNNVVLNFNRTLHSIFGQKGSNEFRCIVACNEIPKLEQEYDSRLEFIKLDMPVPNSHLEMCRDKFWKLTEIAVRVRAILEEQADPENGIYVMPVDADDLLNCHIAEWCENHPYENGAVSKDGYVWTGGYFARIYPELHTYCGSCNIIKMYREDLPIKCPFDIEMCHDKETACILNKRYPIRFNHNEVVKKYADKGKKFEVLPFRSTVYVLKTGDNISSIARLDYNVDNNKKFHPIAFLKKLNIFQYKLVTRRLKKEFSII